MIRLNDQCYVQPEAVVAISVDDAATKVVATVAEVGDISVKREFGEGAYACAERLSGAIADALNQNWLGRELADLGRSIETLNHALASDRQRGGGR